MNLTSTSLSKENLRFTVPKAIAEKLDQLASLRDGWDSYRAKAPSRAARNRAASLVGDFVAPLVARGCHIEIGPALDGGIVLALECDGRELDLRVDNDGALSIGRDEDVKPCVDPGTLKAQVFWLAGM